MSDMIAKVEDFWGRAQQGGDVECLIELHDNPNFVEACCAFLKTSSCRCLLPCVLGARKQRTSWPLHMQQPAAALSKTFATKSQAALPSPCLSEKRYYAEDEKENVDDKGKKPMREEDLPQEQAEADEEAAASPGSRTDMELAWENLEVAKYIYEHEPDGNHAKELAGSRSKP